MGEAFAIDILLGQLAVCQICEGEQWRRVIRERRLRKGKGHGKGTEEEIDTRFMNELNNNNNNRG